MNLTKEELQSKLDYLEDVVGLTGIDEELATEDLKLGISEELIAKYCGKSISNLRKIMCSLALRRKADDKTLNKILRKDIKEDQIKLAYSYVQKGLDIMFVVDNLDNPEFNRLEAYWEKCNHLNIKSIGDNTSETETPKLFADKKEDHTNCSDIKEEKIDMSEEANSESSDKTSKAINNSEEMTEDRLMDVLTGLAKSIDRFESILSKSENEDKKKSEQEKLSKDIEAAIEKQTSELEKRFAEKEAELVKRLDEKEAQLDKLMEEKQAEIEKVQQEKSESDKNISTSIKDNDDLSDRVENLEVFADATNHRMESYMKQIANLVSEKNANEKRISKTDDEDKESKKSEGDNTPADYVVISNDRRGNMVSCVPIEFDRKKSSGIGGVMGLLGFKKKSQQSLVRMVISGELDKAQLGHIVGAMKKGLSEDQLTDLIESRVPADKMPEIIEIALLEKRMGYAY